MMKTWFETKVRYEKTIESGRTKRVTEPYLFDALSFTEAEKRTIEELSPYLSGEFTITAISRAEYSEVHLKEECERFFKCQIVFITVDEKTAKEKETKTNFLIQANDLQNAKDRLTEIMKGTLADYRIGMIKETDIVDVYPIKTK